MASYTFGYGNTYGFGALTVRANIVYNMDTFNVNDADLRTLDNSGSAGIYSDAQMYASNHIFLDGSTQSVDYPIPYTLGSELLTDIGSSVASDDEISTYTKVSSTAFNLAVTTVGTNTIRPFLNTTAPLTNGESFLYTFNCVVNSGTPVLELISNGATNKTIQYTIINGYNEIQIDADGTRSDINLYFKGTNLFDISITALSNKQITNPNSFLTCFDTATKSHVTIDNSIAPNTIYTQEDSHSSTFITTVEVTSADLNYLDANPESIARLVDGETVAGLSFGLADIEAFYPGNEGEASGVYVQDVKTVLSVPASLTLTAQTSANSTLVITDETFTATADGLGTSSNSPRIDIGGIEIGKFYTIIVNETIISGSTNKYLFVNGAFYGGTTPPAGGITGYVFKATSTTTYYSYYDNATAFSLSGDITVREATASEITNYASTCRTNLDLTNYGASNLLYKQDATGRWLGMADAGTIIGDSDGRNIDIQMTIPYNHLVTKDIDKIDGTLDSCTITYVDTTTEIVP